VSLFRSTIGLEVLVWTVFHVLPSGVRRALAGPPVIVDGRRLDPDLRLLLRLDSLTSAGGVAVSLERRRRHQDVAGALGGGRLVKGVSARSLAIPSEHGPIPARLYTPESLPSPSALLIFHHGGGWVTGSLDSHQAVCGYLAARAGVRVLATDYRLAPEHPFPSAVDDALTVFRYVRDHADELDADPAAIAVGGDSAGGNLSAVTAYLTVRAGEASPALLLLLYPPCDAVNLAPSRRRLATGFFLTEADIEWFTNYYLPPGTDRGDPRASISLAPDLSGMPPTYLATAGFDPLRDEGEMFAHRLSEAGGTVVLRRHADLIHGFANMIGLSPRCREALAEAAGALRTALVLSAPHRPAEVAMEPGPVSSCS
jgi:acetyl esterase